jgi:hypothetical protein
MAQPKMDSEVPVRVLEDAMEGEAQIAPKGLKELAWCRTPVNVLG